LIAGHETTSGLLSFAIYFLLEHPEYLDRAREEVDRVQGGTLQPTFDQLHELTFVRQVLDEALRLWPTASGFRRHAKEDMVIGGGRYAVPKDLAMMVLSPMLHRDKSIWGEDAEEFNPDHTTPERMSAIPRTPTSRSGRATEPRLRLTMENKQTTNPVVMSYRAHPSTLVVNRELLGNGQAAPDSRSARHIELELPAGMEYETGDHLGVLPRNNVDLIRRVMARFGLDAGT
jgi:Cytochrome P450